MGKEVMSEPAAVVRTDADRYIETVSHVMNNLALAGESGRMPERLVLAMMEHFGAVLGEIWLFSEEEQALARVTGSATTGEAPAPHSGFAARFQKIGDSEPWAGPVKDWGEGGEEFDKWIQEHGARYALVHPLVAREQCIGAMAVYSDKKIAPASFNWARLYSSIAAVTLDDSRVLLESHKAITQLQFLVEASQVLNSTLDLGELLDLILKLARREIGADRGSVYVVDKDRREIFTILAQGLEQKEIRLAFGQGVAGHVAETGQIMNIADAYTCPQFDRSFDVKFGYRTRTILCMPIRNRQGETAGILQLINKTKGRFTSEDEEFLNAMSVHMSLALENARLHREVVEKKRMERELQLASRIQRSLLPDAPPQIPGFDIAVLNEPCFEVGGDYYDFLTLGPDTLLVVIADVEGKGVSSAMVMSNLQATLHALVMHLHSLEVITLSLNEMILADTHSGKFLSCFLGLVDTRRKGLHYINAGHCPPLIVRKNGDVIQMDKGGMVIGLFSAVDYERGSVDMQAGDVIVCCTDGIMEACNAEQDEFGYERLGEAVHRHSHLPAKELVEAVVKEVTEYSKGGMHTDDKVLMVVKVLEDLDPPSGSKKK